MSRQYKPSEWLEFLTGNEQSKNVKQLQVYFHQRVYELAENYCYENHVDKGMAGDMRIDPEEASYLAYASLAGEGVGLWEGRRPWHADEG